jgi:uncharacterized membrane protein
MEPMKEEQRSKWRESSAVGIAVALMMFILLGAAMLLVIGGWPVFEAQVAPSDAKPNGSVAE